jgi:hypothetical protein
LWILSRFSIRIDPAIGALGEGNTIIQEDSVAMPFNARSPPANNLYGVGYTVEKTTIETSGWADAAPEKNRVFKVRSLLAALSPVNFRHKADSKLALTVDRQPVSTQPRLW